MILYEEFNGCHHLSTQLLVSVPQSSQMSKINLFNLKVKRAVILMCNRDDRDGLFEFHEMASHHYQLQFLIFLETTKHITLLLIKSFQNKT